MSPHLSPQFQVALALGAYFLFSCFAGAMLPPLAGQERTRYGYFFRFVQLLAANAHRLVDARMPGLAAEIAAAEAKAFTDTNTGHPPAQPGTAAHADPLHQELHP